MSIMHKSSEPLNSQFSKIPYQTKSELQKIIKSLANVFTNTSRSLIQTHQIIAKAHPNNGSTSRLASWHNELKESVDSFRKRFGRLLGDLRYFLQAGPQEQADLESISTHLKNNDGSGRPGYLLKKELQELCSVVDNSIVTSTSTNLTNLSFPRNEIPPLNTSLGTTVTGLSRAGGIHQQSPGRIVMNVSNDRGLSGTPRINRHSFENFAGEIGMSNQRINSLNKSGRRRGSIRSKVVVENVASRGNSIDSNSSKVRRYKEEPMGGASFELNVNKKPPQAPTPIKIGNKLVERVEVIQETPKSRRGLNNSRSSMTKTKIEKEIVTSIQLSNSKKKGQFIRSGDKRRRSSLTRSQISVEKVERSTSKKSRILEPTINLQPIEPPSQKKNKRRDSLSRNSGSKRKSRKRGSSNKKRRSSRKRQGKENSSVEFSGLGSRLNITDVSNRTTHIETGLQTPITDKRFKSKVICGEYVREYNLIISSKQVRSKIQRVISDSFL